MVQGIRGISYPCYRSSLSCLATAAGLDPTRRLVPGQVSRKRCRAHERCKGLKQTNHERPRIGTRCSSASSDRIGLGEYLLAHVPSHLPLVAGRHRRPHRRAAEADAARRHHHHGQVWRRADGIQAQAQLDRGAQGLGELIMWGNLPPEPAPKGLLKLQNPVLKWVILGWPVG